MNSKREAAVCLVVEQTRWLVSCWRVGRQSQRHVRPDEQLTGAAKVRARLAFVMQGWLLLETVKKPYATNELFDIMACRRFVGVAWG